MDIKGFRIRLGAEFPDTVRIKRKEIPSITVAQPAIVETGRSGEDTVPADVTAQERSVD